MKKLVYIITLLLLITGYSKAQMVIKGKVVGSDDGLPLPGVTITSKGIENIPPTDINGYFEVPIELGTVLNFSFLGYITRTIEFKENKYYEIVLKPWSTDHDFGWNRIYLGPSYAFNNWLLGGELEYLSNPLIGYDFFINPRLSLYSGSETSVKDANLKIHSFIPRNNKLDASLSFRYQSVLYPSYEFENFTFSIQPSIRGFHFDIGLSTSKYLSESKKNDYLGFLIGFQEEVKIAGHYFPIEYNSIFWQNDIEFNFHLTHRIRRWLRAGITYQHYREFNQIALTLSYSFRLDPKVKNEY